MNLLEKTNLLFGIANNSLIASQSISEKNKQQFQKDGMYRQAANLVKDQDPEKERDYLNKAAADAETNNNLIEALRIYKLLGDEEQAKYVFDKVAGQSNTEALAQAYLIIGEKERYSELLPELIETAQRENRFYDIFHYLKQQGETDKIKGILPQLEKSLEVIFSTTPPDLMYF